MGVGEGVGVCGGKREEKERERGGEGVWGARGGRRVRVGRQKGF